MDSSLYHGSHSENSANNGAHVNQELENILALVRVLDCYLTDLVVEHKDRFRRFIISFFRSF